MTVTLEGDTLGKKHQHYNKLVQEAVAKGNYKLSQITSEDSDLDNLLKIDIACKTRNVDYVIEVLKSNDMLYVSRAIKKSPWLITDPQYENIINPEYLHSQLFPSMHTKAINKLMLNVRLNLKDPCRVEAFYNHLKGSKEAYKWLLNCSVPFIADAIKNESNMPMRVFKRLCKKSISILSSYKHLEEFNQCMAISNCLFLLRNHPKEYLDLLENEKYIWLPNMGRKHTEVLMKKCSKRVFNKFEFYVSQVELSVVAKHMEKTDIKAFLEEQIKNDKMKSHFSHFKKLRYFVKNMPIEERCQFIKQTFIEKVNTPVSDATSSCLQDISCNVESYLWYEYVPYNEAFNSLVKLLRAESSPLERIKILSILIKCARNNPQHIKSVLQYYFEKHINEPFNFKFQFVNKVLTQIPSYNVDDEIWNLLDQIFHSMEVYSESGNDVQTCLKAIIAYKVIHDEKVPEIVERKFHFDTFKNNCNKLSQEQKDKLFSYLLNLISDKIQNQTLEDESDCNEMISYINSAFSLLIDWKKDINDYPFILDYIKKLTIIKKEKNCYMDLSSFYNVKKSWRKYMFEDSFAFCVNEDVCLNALKHNPELLTRHDEQLHALRTNDNVTLHRLLAKLRVYWPQSIAQQWTDAYLLYLDNTTVKKAVVRGLFMLMTQKQVIEMAEKHKPEDFKIKWGETSPTDINLRKYIAQCVHVARPLVPLETVLWYAKKDYLQYAVPSINAVMYYMSKKQSRDNLTMLLEAPVSLQKFGIRYAIVKLPSDELKPIYSKIWQSTKNLSTRAVLFTSTYSMLCKAKLKTVEEELWELLSMFIDNLSSDDNKEIFRKLTRLKDLPRDVQPDFFMKSYNFLMSLPESVNGQTYVNQLLESAPKIIGLLDEEFVLHKMLTPEKILSSKSAESIEFLATFVLSSKNEEDQLRRHRRVLLPTMELSLKSWDIVFEYEFATRNKFKNLLKSLIWFFVKMVSVDEITPPVQLFTEIQKFMEEKLTIHQNYVLYTSWKLSTEYVKIISENKSLLSVFEPFANSYIEHSWLPDEQVVLWNDINATISQKFGLKMVEHLKQDIEEYFPTIFLSFGDAMNKTFRDLSHRDIFTVETLNHMLDEDFVSSYLVAIIAAPKCNSDEIQKALTALRIKLRSHPDKEVQMFYYLHFEPIPDF